MDADVPSTKCLKCQVCGDIAFTKNFGVNACRACAAFFRRSVACVKKYKCKAVTGCVSYAAPDLGKPPFCKNCRLRKCFQVGMRSHDVKSLSRSNLLVLGFNDDTLLNRVTHFRRFMFMRRLHILSSDGVDVTVRRCQRATTQSTVSANKAEMKILRDFFSSTSDIGIYLRSDVTTNALATHFFLVWYTLENVLATARNCGYRRSRVYCTDDAYFDTSIEALQEDFSSFPVSNKDVLARHAVEKWKSLLELSEAIKPKNLDEFELSAITQLLFLKYESESFQNDEARRKYANEVFSGLHADYARTSKDFTLSFDRIATVLAGFHICLHDFSELMAMLDMYTPLEICPDSHVLVHSYRCRQGKAIPSANMKLA